MGSYGEGVSLATEPEVLADQPPAPEQEHPATRWARRHAKPLVFVGVAALIVVTGLLVRELTEPAPAIPADTPPVVTVRVEGDVTGTTGVARFASGGQTNLTTGQSDVGGLTYVSTSPSRERVVAVSVAVIAGKGDAHCTVSVGDRVVESESVSDGGLALCFWAGDAGNPPPFRTDQ